MIIGGRNTAQGPLVVAEIGNNHEGRFDVARQLVERAVECGVDAVKFQTFRTELFVSPKDEARYKRMSGFELTAEQFGELSRLARSLGVLFISTPLDMTSANVLEPLVDAYKIASGDNDFLPLISRVAASSLPVIISSGSSDVTRVRTAVETVRRARGADAKLALMHCVSCYPAPPEQANLAAIGTLAAEFGLPTGYSDHTIGIDACVLSVAAGARLIEKHFTLDHHYSDFRDHQLSADPSEMAELVRRVRAAATMMGTGAKVPQACELDSAPAIRRSIVSSRELPAGHRLSLEDLCWHRPAGGMAPGSEEKLIGRRLKRATPAFERLMPADVE